MLLTFINNMKAYSSVAGRKPWQEFLEHNSKVGMTPNIAQKYQTMATFFCSPEQAPSLKVLEEWMRNDDPSRFMRGHIDFGDFKRLEEKERVDLLQKYKNTSMSYEFFFPFI